MTVIIFILSIIITIKICSWINQNTIGTMGAYFTRGFVVWGVTFMVLIGIWNAIIGRL